MNKLTSLLSFALIIWSSSLMAQSQDLSPFDAISVSGSLNVTLVNADKNSLDLDMVKGDADKVITIIKGNELVLKIKNNWGMGNKVKANITVYHDGISNIDVSAGAYVHTDDTIQSDNMSVEVSSGAKCNATIAAQSLDVDISSGASSTLKGKSTKQSVEVSSGASYNGQDMESNETSVDVSSGASAKVWANEKINAEASSGGSIKYKGDPTTSNIEVGKYTGGSIKKMN